MSSDPDRTTTVTIPALALSATEAAAAALGIGERLLWSMTNRREIPHVKIGRRTVYPVRELERYLSKRATGGAA